MYFYKNRLVEMNMWQDNKLIQGKKLVFTNKQQSLGLFIKLSFPHLYESCVTVTLELLGHTKMKAALTQLIESLMKQNLSFHLTSNLPSILHFSPLAQRILALRIPRVILTLEWYSQYHHNSPLINLSFLAPVSAQHCGNLGQAFGSSLLALD